jgi:hypothetical protein
VPAYDNVLLPRPPDIEHAGQYGQQLFQMLSQLPRDYWSGQEQRYNQRNRDLFQDGVPTVNGDPNGPVDWNAVMRKTLESGGAAQADKFAQLGIDLEQQRRFYNGLPDLRPNAGPASSPAAAAPANLTPGSQPQPRLSSAGMDSAGAESVQSLAVGIAGGRSISGPAFQGAVANAARMLGIDPNQPLSAAQQARAGRLLAGSFGGATAPTTTGGVAARNPVSRPGLDGDDNNTNQGTPVGATGGSPISPAPTSASGAIAGTPSGRRVGVANSPHAAGPQNLTPPAQPGQAQPSFNDRFDAAYGRGGQGGAPVSTPIGSASDADELDRRAQRAYELSAAPRIQPAQAEAARKIGDQLTAQARQIREQLGQYGAPQHNPEIQGELHRFEGASKAVGDQIGEYVKQMPAARQTINELSVIGDALKSAKGNLTTGPGAEFVLRAKQFLNNAGVPVKGLTEAETMEKMNRQLSATVSWELTQRPTQAEFLAFQRNLPGIMNSPQGTVVLLDVMRQISEQKIALGRLAMNQNNWPRWGEVEDQFFHEHPIALPFSGAPATGNAPLPKGVRSIEVVH